jgi:hypothetical protein
MIVQIGLRAGNKILWSGHSIGVSFACLAVAKFFHGRQA